MNNLIKFFFSALLLCSGFGFSQNTAKIPSDIVFYMEINGKQLDKKINWEKINPFLSDVNQKGKTKLNWNDYAKTGIDYDATQIHYATHDDSITSYTIHFEIDNENKFLEFVNSAKKEGREAVAKNNYSYIDLDHETFVAWNNKYAVLKYIDYKKPAKQSTTEDAIDATKAIDSVAVATMPEEEGSIVLDVDPTEEVEAPFDYKEEIKYLKSEIEYLNDGIKESKKQIAEIQKNIAYLQKHHKYPVNKDPYIQDKEEYKNEDSQEDGGAKELPPADEPAREYGLDDSDYKREMDSIDIENYKIAKQITEISFNQYFSSNFKIEADARITSARDENADAFLYTNFSNFYSTLYEKNNPFFYGIQNFMRRSSNADSYYNIYFEKDKVRLVNNYQHRDAELQKDIVNIHKAKKNKKLASLIDENSMAHLAINVNAQKHFDLIYHFFNNDRDEDQQEIKLFIETMKIVLDEKAISKVAPGNIIFTLNDLKKKKVEYTAVEFDDNYNEKEIKKTKEITVPDFTFAFATENQGYWSRVFDAMLANKYFGKNMVKYGNIYSYKEENDREINKMFFCVKDNIVYFTTSIENLNKEKPKKNNSKISKESTKHAMYGKIDFQRILKELEGEVKNESNKKTFDYFKKNVGDLIYKTDAKENSVKTEVIYQLRNTSSENSLMYFFDMFSILYKEDAPKAEKIN